MFCMDIGGLLAQVYFITNTFREQMNDVID